MNITEDKSLIAVPIGKILPTEYLLIQSDSDFKKRENQKYNSIIYQSHFFKRCEKKRELGYKTNNILVEELYQCSVYQCSSLFLLYIDKTADIVNVHNGELNHLQDAFIEQRLYFKWFCIDKLQMDFDRSPSEIITEYISKNKVTVYTPSKKFMYDKISSLKRKDLGLVLGPSIREIDLGKSAHLQDSEGSRMLS